VNGVCLDLFMFPKLVLIRSVGNKFIELLQSL